MEYGAIPVVEDFSDFKGCDVGDSRLGASNEGREVNSGLMDGLSVLCQDPSGWLSDAPVYKTSDWSDFATLLSDALSDSTALDAKQAEVVSQKGPSKD
jgi:hypothetical protein